MGIYAELYHHASAITLVPALNEWRRMWGVAPHREWVERRIELGVEGGDGVPPDASEINFASSTEVYPTNRSLTWIEAFLRENKLRSLYACLGYPSAEPEDINLAPDWPAVRAAFASLLDALRAPGIETPARPAGLHPRVHFTPPEAADCIALVSAFLELAEWVLAQPRPEEYFVRWSW